MSSVAPNSPSLKEEMPMDDEMERPAGVDAGDEVEDTPDGDARPVWNQDHGSPTIPEPPSINLTSRT